MGYFRMLFILFATALLWACNTNDWAKSSDCQIVDFAIEEYPDVEIDRSDPYIILHMDEPVSDLRMTPVFTVSAGATVRNEGTESGVKRDIGQSAKITVVSEDGLYLSTYKIMAVYPDSKVDFNSASLPQESEKYGEDFVFSFVDFPGSAAASGLLKWNGFAMSNRKAPDMDNPPASVLPWQLYPAEDSGLGNMVFARLGYGAENAVEVSFGRPINPDSLTVVPSALTLYCMKNGYADETGQVVAAMNMDDKDYMVLVLEGYDGDGELVGTKEQYIANFSLPERPYIREGWQTLKLKSTKIKNIKKLKMYVRGEREAFYPIFAIDKLSYQVQPQATPSDDEQG